VLSIRPDGDGAVPYRNVLVPTDGSERAADALDRALTLAKRADATVHVLTVVDVATVGGEGYSGVDALVEGAEETVMEAAATAEEAGVDRSRQSRSGRLQRGIQSYIDENDIDLVVMGTQGRTGVKRYLLGSVAERTVRTSPVPVLTVSDPGDEAGDETGDED